MKKKLKTIPKNRFIEEALDKEKKLTHFQREFIYKTGDEIQEEICFLYHLIYQRLAPALIDLVGKEEFQNLKVIKEIKERMDVLATLRDESFSIVRSQHSGISTQSTSLHISRCYSAQDKKF